jgi:diaminopimelate decarboxylase
VGSRAWSARRTSCSARRRPSLWIEPGRSLVAERRRHLYTVESVKQRDSTWWRSDGGMSDNLRPMLYGSPYTADVADRVGAEGEPCHLVGKHCESGTYRLGVRAAHPRPGDVIVTPATGAVRARAGQQLQRRPRPP